MGDKTLVCHLKLKDVLCVPRQIILMNFVQTEILVDFYFASILNCVLTQCVVIPTPYDFYF